MVRRPEIMSARPNEPNGSSDVASQVLGAVRLDAKVFGRFELGAPWAVHCPATAGHLAFYVMAEGQAVLEVEGGTIALAAGDVVLLPHIPELTLRDPGPGPHTVQPLGPSVCPTPGHQEPVRFGGDGPPTVFVAGAFRFGAATPNVLIDSLPAVVHVPAAEVEGNGQLAATVQLILAESAVPGPGAAILTSRLAEILLIHALRAWMKQRREKHEPGICALADPAVGAALTLIHARPAEPWTVDRLAREVAMSRSAFAARFTERVGVPPLQYLTQWRMTQAAQQLREGGESVKAIAERVGYQNPAAFMKAFTRVLGVGPGAYRREARGRVAVVVNA